MLREAKLWLIHRVVSSMRDPRCVRARRRRVESEIEAGVRRLAELKPAIAVVGDTPRPAEIVDRLVALVRR